MQLWQWWCRWWWWWAWEVHDCAASAAASLVSAHERAWCEDDKHVLTMACVVSCLLRVASVDSPTSRWRPSEVNKQYYTRACHKVFGTKRAMRHVAPIVFDFLCPAGEGVVTFNAVILRGFTQHLGRSLARRANFCFRLADTLDTGVVNLVAVRCLCVGGCSSLVWAPLRVVRCGV